jgi:hypothetical protein
MLSRGVRATWEFVQVREATRHGQPAMRFGRVAGQLPKCTNFPLLFGIAMFLPLHQSVSEDFLTW